LIFTLAALVILFAVERQRHQGLWWMHRARAAAERRNALENEEVANHALGNGGGLASLGGAETESVGTTNLSGKELEAARQLLTDRLVAATAIGHSDARDSALSLVAVDAAKVGDVELVNNALREMGDFNQRCEAARESALQLAKHGRKMQAIDIAKDIGNGDMRDQTLSELAQ
jgi:hypothetical protein